MNDARSPGAAGPRATGEAADHSLDVARGERFQFGRNWRAFLAVVDDERIRAACADLTEMLQAPTLAGMTFLDVGSGSGLSSLAARTLGARVVSFDYDPDSVACTEELRRRYFLGDPDWRVQRGSALDERFLERLGTFDIVYSWGVLHHTGDMWRAMDLITRSSTPGGYLFVALYNDGGKASERWRRIKRFYCSGRLGRLLVGGTFTTWWFLRALVSDTCRGRSPVQRYRNYRKRRGMSIVHDWIDWLGGYPYEVTTPEKVFEFYTSRGFALLKLRTSGGPMGVNQFVFRRPPR
jgi:SAM-dependent methyltransferase